MRQQSSNEDDADGDQLNNWPLIIGFCILMPMVLYVAHLHGQL